MKLSKLEKVRYYLKKKGVKLEANILTVLAVLVAGFTLLSEEKRIDLKLRISKVDIFGLVIVFLLILYMVYLPFLEKIGLIIPLPWLLYIPVPFDQGGR